MITDLSEGLFDVPLGETHDVHPASVCSGCRHARMHLPDMFCMNQGVPVNKTKRAQ